MTSHKLGHVLARKTPTFLALRMESSAIAPPAAVGGDQSIGPQQAAAVAHRQRKVLGFPGIFWLIFTLITYKAPFWPSFLNIFTFFFLILYFFLIFLILVFNLSFPKKIKIFAFF
jgi:hypothetical protein